MFQRLTPVTKNLIIVNVVVFIMIFIMQRSYINIPEYLSLHSPKFDRFQPFQLVTTMFTHFDPLHILFNMIGLYFFGPLVEQRVGAERTLIAYIAGGLFSGIVFLLYYTYFSVRDFELLGASGSVYTILILAALYFKNAKVQLLFPPITLTLGVLALIYIGYDVVSFLGRANTGVAHLAHLGGAAMGVILWWIWEKSGTRKR